SILLEQCMQFVNDLPYRPRVWTEIAPSVPRTVVRAHTRKCRDARLYETPLHREVADAGFQNHSGLRRLGFARAIEMQPPAAYIDQFARWRKRRRVDACLRNHPNSNHDRQRKLLHEHPFYAAHTLC